MLSIVAELRRRIEPVDPVEEHDPRLAVLPRELDDHLEHLARRDAVDHLAAVRIDEGVVAVLLDRLHELVGDSRPRC